MAAANGQAVGGQSPVLAVHRAEIDQAAGMLTIQLGTGVAEAFARLRAYAYTSDRPLAGVGSDIVFRAAAAPRRPGPGRRPVTRPTAPGGPPLSFLPLRR